nr:MAG TPA: hypothetical protein [Caudoviricetes sp.]
MPLFRGLITPLVRAFILGVYLYTPVLLRGLWGFIGALWRGLYIGACSCVSCPVFPLLLLCVCVPVGHC